MQSDQDPLTESHLTLSVAPMLGKEVARPSHGNTTNVGPGAPGLRISWVCILKMEHLGNDMPRLHCRLTLLMLEQG